MSEKLKKYGKYAFTGLMALMLVGGVLTACYGFDAGDIVVSRTPTAVQAPVYVDGVDESGNPMKVKISDGVPELVSHNQSAKHFEIWQTDVLRTGQIWKANLEESGKSVVFLNSWKDLGVAWADSQLAGLGLVGMGGTGLLASLLIKRPKDKTPAEVEAEIAKKEAQWADIVSKEKRDSYNEAERRAKESQVILLNLLKANGVDVPESVVNKIES